MDPSPHVQVTPLEILHYIETVSIRNRLEQHVGVQRAAQIHALAVQGQLSVAELNGILFVSFPTWIYYRNGKRYVVDTPADLATQPPGHGRSPGEPWLDGLEGKVPWEFGQAPFAPAHYATPLRYGTELVCASKLLIYAGLALCRGKRRPGTDQFSLLGDQNVDDLPPVLNR